MATPSPIEIVETFRSRLLRREASAMRAVVRAYLQASIGIKKRIDEIASASDLTVNKTLAIERLRSLQRQIDTEIKAFASEASGIVSDAQTAAVGLVEEQTAQILSAFSRLATGAVGAIAGGFESSGRLTALFESIGPGLSQSAYRIFVDGIARGLGTAAVARRLRDSLGVGLHRATVISRTEILNAYRDATSANFQANRDVVRGWIWYAALGSRCCAACTVLHGTKHSVDEPFVSHPMCRCVQLPMTDAFKAVQSGTAWLAQQDEATQVEIVGKAGYRALQSGEIKLNDFIGSVRSSVFGPARYQRSLKSIMGLDEAKRFYRKAA